MFMDAQMIRKILELTKIYHFKNVYAIKVRFALKKTYLKNLIHPKIWKKKPAQ